jgi:2-oxoglutarate ferredoxin oxidoreductase subunit gamma
MRKEIRICGIGGQGVILAGSILGKATSVYMDYHAVHSQAFGPEARGGSVKSEVIISDNTIDYHRSLAVDLLVLMAEKSWDSCFFDFKEDTKVLFDPDLVKKTPQLGKIYPIHAQKIAEQLGNKIVTNIVMVGAMTKILAFVDETAVRSAVLDAVPLAYKELNLNAFQQGLTEAETVLRENGCE